MLLSEAVDSRWQLAVDGQAQPRRTAFGWATAWDVTRAGSGALRYRTATDWVRFEMLREVIASGDWKLTLSLTGIGDARIDDLQVLALDPLPDADFAAEEPTIQPAGGLLDKLPRFPGLPTRRRD